MAPEHGGNDAKRNSAPSHAIDKHRWRFLRAVEGMPVADAKFRQLARVAANVRGVALARIIEDWAIECHLAEMPIDRWWIVDHVAQWLRRLATDPPDFNFPECADAAVNDLDESEQSGDERQMIQEHRERWYSYSSVGGFVSVPQALPFRLYAYDPAFSTLAEYEAEMRESFAVYFDDYVKRQPAVPEKLTERHYSWLVRYQVLGESFEDIAKSTDASESAENRPSPLTVKKAVLDLRRLIDLPRRASGRPRKLVEPR